MDELTDALLNPQLREGRSRIPVPDQLSAKDIKRYRQELGITQKEFGLMLAVPLSVVQGWERGRETPPGMLAWAIRYLAIALDPRREII